jgi:hypothetical protein
VQFPGSARGQVQPHTVDQSGPLFRVRPDPHPARIEIGDLAEKRHRLP